MTGTFSHWLSSEAGMVVVKAIPSPLVLFSIIMKGVKMHLEDIMNLNFEDDKSYEIMQKVLKKIKAFSKYEEVSLEQLEKFATKIVYKYDVSFQWIMISKNNNNLLYSLSMKRDSNGDWLGTVYGISLYELFAKLNVKLYSMVKNEEVKKR